MWKEVYESIPHSISLVLGLGQAFAGFLLSLKNQGLKHDDEIMRKLLLSLHQGQKQEEITELNNGQHVFAAISLGDAHLAEHFRAVGPAPDPLCSFCSNCKKSLDCMD